MSDGIFTPVFRCNATLNDENISPGPDNIQMELNNIKKQISAATEKLDALINIQAKNNLLMQRILEKVEKKVNFPVLDVRGLDVIENDVAKNKDVYVSNIRNIIGQVGIVNGMKKIISDKTMAQMNYDGLQDKIPFKKYENLNDALYEATQDGSMNGTLEDHSKWRKIVTIRQTRGKNQKLQKQQNNFDKLYLIRKNVITFYYITLFNDLK
ncbi:uncharacterized protein [Eurosta solidaginis]|uniref:uncharacterized protein n=1 Tax=Eurosta solidaginis TaxID=178769 RepID=UPI0035306B12